MIFRFTPTIQTTILASLLGLFITADSSVYSQETSPEPPVSVPMRNNSAPGVPKDLVTVNWGEELMEGGVTMIALGLLSVAMLAFAVERLLFFKPDRFVPMGFVQRMFPLFAVADYDQILAMCRSRPSTLSRAITYAVHHRHLQADMLMQNTSDVVAREMSDQEERCMPFSVIAALAPLLGLLGTMIGMIEAFKLVEVFGDEGGASLLAGSISKALITTAVGLILAIPSIGLYYYFKNRLHHITQRLEADLEELFSQWFLRMPPQVETVENAYADPTPTSFE